MRQQINRAMQRTSSPRVVRDGGGGARGSRCWHGVAAHLAGTGKRSVNLPHTIREESVLACWCTRKGLSHRWISAKKLRELPHKSFNSCTRRSFRRITPKKREKQVRPTDRREARRKKCGSQKNSSLAASRNFAILLQGSAKWKADFASLPLVEIW